MNPKLGNDGNHGNHYRVMTVTTTPHTDQLKINYRSLTTTFTSQENERLQYMVEPRTNSNHRLADTIRGNETQYLNTRTVKFLMKKSSK